MLVEKVRETEDELLDNGYVESIPDMNLEKARTANRVLSLVAAGIRGAKLRFNVL